MRLLRLHRLNKLNEKYTHQIKELRFQETIARRVNDYKELKRIMHQKSIAKAKLVQVKRKQWLVAKEIKDSFL